MIESAHSDPNPLDEAEILQQLEREESQTRRSTTPLMAFGTVLVASLYVGILAMARSRPVEAARPIPRWVPWTYSFEEAQARAAKNHQKIFIDFYTDWCPGCKEMDAVVYTRPEVLEQSQNVVMVKINAEGRADLAKRYGIHVYPSMVWTDEKGQETGRHDGGAGARTLVGLMAQNR